jgi:hypothetical protein
MSSQSAKDLTNARPFNEAGHLIEVDLADPATMKMDHWRYSGTNAYLRLQELCPADPGELSGAELRILESGTLTILLAIVGGSHWVGWLKDAPLAQLIAALSGDNRGCEIDLFESYPGMRPLRPSGATLRYDDDEDLPAGSDGDNPPIPGLKLGLYFGSHRHCLGLVVAGPSLDAFLKCLAYRYSDATN